MTKQLDLQVFRLQREIVWFINILFVGLRILGIQTSILLVRAVNEQF